MRRCSWATTSASGGKSSPGCWKAKNSRTWNPNDSASRTGSTPPGQPSTTVAPAGRARPRRPTARPRPRWRRARGRGRAPPRPGSRPAGCGAAATGDHAVRPGGRVLGAGGDAQRRPQVAGRPGERAHRGQVGHVARAGGGPGGWNPVSGTTPTLGLQPVDAAEAGRDADRADQVRPVLEEAQPGGHRGGRPAGGAARGPRRVPRVVGDAVQRRWPSGRSRRA